VINVLVEQRIFIWNTFVHYVRVLIKQYANSVYFCNTLSHTATGHVLAYSD